jgi:hypothetical protein
MEDWNYFNYFTEIEEYFWKRRGAHLLVSPLDWAIMESWQKAGVPLEAALKGIDRAFECYQRSRRGAGKTLKNLAYCTDAVLEAAEESHEAAAGAAPKGKAATADIFSREELCAHVQKKTEQIAKAAQRCKKCQPELAAVLENVSETLAGVHVVLDAPGNIDLEDLERRLTIIDDKLHAAVLTHASEELMLKARREVDSQLAAYRRKMKAAQLGMVERQYLQKRLLDEYLLPRVSLYYFS